MNPKKFQKHPKHPKTSKKIRKNPKNPRNFFEDKKSAHPIWEWTTPRSASSTTGTLHFITKPKWSLGLGALLNSKSPAGRIDWCNRRHQFSSYRTALNRAVLCGRPTVNCFPTPQCQNVHWTLKVVFFISNSITTNRFEMNLFTPLHAPPVNKNDIFIWSQMLQNHFI